MKIITIMYPIYNKDISTAIVYFPIQVAVQDNQIYNINSDSTASNNISIDCSLEDYKEKNK